jgi:2-C-methyl-D-erythritol 4-phosphate cytidylyltransferase
MAVALVVAAGRGERLGLDRPKALVTLAGKPMLDWSVATLRRVREVHRIMVALPAEELDAAPPGTTAVAGGAVRSESVRAALEGCPAGDPVIVHDAARPLAPAELFRRALKELDRAGADAVVAAAPVSDTIKEVAEDGRTVLRTLERTRLWAVQTPQVFKRAALERALSEASDELLAAATDDAWLIERAGGIVHVVQSSPSNLKVTTPNDLQIAEMMLGR